MSEEGEEERRHEKGECSYGACQQDEDETGVFE